MSALKKVIFAMIPAIVLFGALEVGCRIWERFDDDVTAFARAAESMPAKEPNEFRVVLYGGSTVVGEPERAGSFAEQMKTYLAELVPHRTIRFFNYAGSGKPSAYAVRKLHQTLKGSEADAVVVLTAHNEFLSVDDMTAEELNSLYAIHEAMHRSALVRRMRRLYYRYYTARRSDLLGGDNLSPFDRKSKRFVERVELYEQNVDVIVALVKREGVPLFFCTGPSNLADWAPSNAKFSAYAKAEEYGLLVEELHRLILNQELEQALKKSMVALERFPDDALLTYSVGKCLLMLGNGEQADEWLTKARDLDPFPYRVLSRFNDKVRSMEEPPAVRVVDLARIFRERAPRKVPGYELVSDNCHPTPLGSFIVATQLIDEFGRAGLIEFEGPAEKRVALEPFLEASGFRLKQATYHLDNARVAMKAPYLDFGQAEKEMVLALKHDPDSWEVLANAGTVLLVKGDLQKANEFLKRATERKGSAINVNDTEKVPFLKDALESRGFELESLLKSKEESP